jgi:hypothetical protein
VFFAAFFFCFVLFFDKKKMSESESSESSEMESSESLPMSVNSLDEAPEIPSLLSLEPLLDFDPDLTFPSMKEQINRKLGNSKSATPTFQYDLSLADLIRLVGSPVSFRNHFHSYMGAIKDAARDELKEFMMGKGVTTRKTTVRVTVFAWRRRTMLLTLQQPHKGTANVAPLLPTAPRKDHCIFPAGWGHSLDALDLAAPPPFIKALFAPPLVDSALGIGASKPSTIERGVRHALTKGRTEADWDPDLHMIGYYAFAPLHDLKKLRAFKDLIAKATGVSLRGAKRVSFEEDLDLCVKVMVEHNEWKGDPADHLLWELLPPEGEGQKPVLVWSWRGAVAHVAMKPGLPGHLRD